jgi:hypothetical protein
MADVAAWLAVVVVVAAVRVWPLYALGVAAGLAVVVVAAVITVLAAARCDARRAARRLAEDRAQARVEDEPEPGRAWLVSAAGFIVDDQGRRV